MWLASASVIYTFLVQQGITDTACPTPHHLLRRSFSSKEKPNELGDTSKNFLPYTFVHNTLSLYLYRFKDCKLTARCCVKDMLFQHVTDYYCSKSQVLFEQPKERTRNLPLFRASLRLSSLKSATVPVSEKIIPYYSQ